MNPWQLPYLSPFQTGVVTHLPAPVGSWLPTPCLAPVLGRAGSFSMSCWLGQLPCLDANTSGSFCSLSPCSTNCWAWDRSLAHLPPPPAPHVSLTTTGRLATAPGQTRGIRSSEQEGLLEFTELQPLVFAGGNRFPGRESDLPGGAQQFRAERVPGPGLLTPRAGLCPPP